MDREYVRLQTWISLKEDAPAQLLTRRGRDRPAACLQLASSLTNPRDAEGQFRERLGFRANKTGQVWWSGLAVRRGVELALEPRITYFDCTPQVKTRKLGLEDSQVGSWVLLSSWPSGRRIRESGMRPFSWLTVGTQSMGTASSARRNQSAIQLTISLP